MIDKQWIGSKLTELNESCIDGRHVRRSCSRAYLGGVRRLKGRSCAASVPAFSVVPPGLLSLILRGTTGHRHASSIPGGSSALFSFFKAPASRRPCPVAAVIHYRWFAPSRPTNMMGYILSREKAHACYWAAGDEMYAALHIKIGLCNCKSSSILNQLQVPNFIRCKKKISYKCIIWKRFVHSI
jgi:hypothetical protein